MTFKVGQKVNIYRNGIYVNTYYVVDSWQPDYVGEGAEAVKFVATDDIYDGGDQFFYNQNFVKIKDRNEMDLFLQAYSISKNFTTDELYLSLFTSIDGRMFSYIADCYVYLDGNGNFNTYVIVDDGEEFFADYYPINTEVILDEINRYENQVGVIKRYVKTRDTIGYEVEVCDTKIITNNNGIKRRLLPDEDYVAPPIPEYRCCSRCGIEYTITEQEIEKLSDNDSVLCPECRKRRYVTPYHRYTPSLNFHSVNGENDDLFFGIELEVELGGESDRIAGEVVDIMTENNNSFVYVSHDSSLNNGFEIITQPATINYHRRLEEKYCELFKYLVGEGYRGHNANNAGIHIHFSRKFFGVGKEEELRTLNLINLINRFWNQIVIFSRRDYNKSRYYMKKISEDWDSSESYLCKYDKTSLSDGHHYAINIVNEDTIELRMFKSTLNPNTFMCILDFVDKVVRTVKDKSLSELNDMKFEDFLTPRALEYYNQRLAMREYDEV